MPTPLPRLRSDEVPTQFHERMLTLTAGRWGGLEVRPSRVFLWLGARQAGREWLVPLADKPRLLRRPRLRRHLSLGSRVDVSYLGNPAATFALFGYAVVRRLLSGTPGGGETR